MTRNQELQTQRGRKRDWETDKYWIRWWAHANPAPKAFPYPQSLRSRLGSGRRYSNYSASGEQNQQPQEKREKESVCVCVSHNRLSILTHIFFLHSSPHLSHIFFMLHIKFKFPLKTSLFTTPKTKNNRVLLFFFFLKVWFSGFI